MICAGASSHTCDLIGDSAPMVELAKSIEKAAPTNSTVLIQGESGTGKELVAHAIVSKSNRSKGPFVALNCAGLPETLLESELFGHEKGAFTSADRQHKGKFELADGGTLFLDEVGELTPTAQAKLLRVLQEHEIDRVGGTLPIRIDIRLIAATNCDLQKSIATGRFREDLYYRLNVFSLRTPPLRERREDIPALAHHFAVKYGRATSRIVRGVSPEVLSMFEKHHWPGNVRELENIIHRAVLEGETDMVRPEDLPSDFSRVTTQQFRTNVGNYYKVMDETARQLCIQAFAVARGDYRTAAGILGLHRKSMHRLIRRLGLAGLLD
jgi:transcriptional regulator with GAF, ATPase, and Fis domain